MTNDKPVTIASLDFENVKRIKAVALEPKADGLTVIGGRNAQGKTSVLDAICWALGGAKYRPDEPHRDGSVLEPCLRVELSNGIIAERSGKSGTLKVTDPSGAKAGQALLDSFVEQFALDLPRFMSLDDKGKAAALLKTIGVGDELAEMEKREAALSQERLTTGQMERKRRGAAETLPWHDEAPREQIDISGLIERQRHAMQHNNENARRRDALASLKARIDMIAREAEDYAARAEAKNAEYMEECARFAEMKVAVDALDDMDVSGISEAIASANEANAKVADNQARLQAMAEADSLKVEYDRLTAEIEGVRAERIALLDGAGMPLPGLSVEGGLLSYNGHVWGDMSSSEQLRVAAAIVRKINPACGFVLVDKLEQMDSETLAEFGAWCEGEGLQVIGTRVSTGDDCTVVIEDGSVREDQRPIIGEPIFDTAL